MSAPLERLKHHVSGAIERGEKKPIEALEPIPRPCTFCNKEALVLLSPRLLAQQPDRTNVVCHPALGGCNHGFELEGFPVAPARKAHR